MWTGTRKDGQYIDVDLGDAAHWDVLRLLGWEWAGRFAVQVVSELPAARALWEATKSAIA